MKNEYLDDTEYENAKRNARNAGRDHVRLYPDKRLREIGFGLQGEMDLYAIFFREGFYEAGGKY